MRAYLIHYADPSTPAAPNRTILVEAGTEEAAKEYVRGEVLEKSLHTPRMISEAFIRGVSSVEFVSLLCATCRGTGIDPARYADGGASGPCACGAEVK